MSTKKPILSVKDLHVSFNTYEGVIKAIRGVSFDLFQGETLAIVGESGSGKSVSTKAITQLLPRNAHINGGEIIYNGKNILKYSDKKMNSIRGNEVAMIFQDPMISLNPTMTVGDQIAEPLLTHLNLSKSEAKKETVSLMQEVGISNAEQRYSQYPHQFSGGMRQRVMIAIAVACKPKVMIADEPTTALDVTIQAQIISLLKRLNQKYKMATIFITHDLGVVANIADRIAVMYAGQIVEVGTADEIFFNPQHPYTWGLLMAVPDMELSDAELYAIPGTPPNLLHVPKGDPFAFRNKYALDIDFEKQPPVFKLSETHYAATWLLDKRAPKYTPPEPILERWKIFHELQSKGKINYLSRVNFEKYYSSSHL